MNRINENYFEIIGLLLIGIFVLELKVKTMVLSSGSFLRRVPRLRGISIFLKFTNRLKIFYTDFSWRKIRREAA